MTNQPKLTRAEVEASPYLAQQVRNQAAAIRGDLTIDGMVSWCGAGYHRTSEDVRRFAFRVLIAKGELHANPRDDRFFLPGRAA